MATNSLLSRMLKSGSVSGASILSESSIFAKKNPVTTELPVLNIAFSGEVDGGLVSGLTIAAGNSKTFKSALSLYCMKAYLDKYADAIAIFYDTEFGITEAYIQSFGIDPNRVLHIPVEHIEMLKFDMTKKLDELKLGDKVFFLVDSIGQISSKKEVDDAVDEKSVADMSRAKALRSLFRLVTIQLAKKDLPCIMINHVYQTMEMFCLAGETVIRTESGTKMLKDVNVGDMVYGREALREVTRKYTPDELPTQGVRYLKMTFDDGTSVQCTNTHKFLMANNTWVEAGNISVGDEFK